MRLNPIKYSDIEKYPHYFKLSQHIKEDFFGSSPSVFVGRFGYPDVNVGILTPQETQNASLHDAPHVWAQQNYTIPQVADLRLSLINAYSKSNIKKQARINEYAKLVGLSSKPVDVEIHLKNKPKMDPLTDRIIMPMGPGAAMKSVKITENPKIHTKVEKVYADTDLKASSALRYLYDNSFDENILSRILSVAALGVKKNRKLVPTRWSITATDSTLANYLLTDIKQFTNHHDYAIHMGNYLGNYYIILFFPEIWSYELFEMYIQETHMADVNYSTDYEPYAGRTAYAQNCAGGFYSVRLAIAEHLKQIKRQAGVLAIRFITGEYTLPLGVWVTREAARKALTNTPITFASKELMLAYIKEHITRKFSFSIMPILQESRLLNTLKVQTKLTHF